MIKCLVLSSILLCFVILRAENKNIKPVETQNRGTGWFLGTTFSPKMQGGLEVGYLFNSNSGMSLNERRFGISIEYLAFQGENTFYNKNSDAFTPKGNSTGIKLIACTPVFSNSITISGYAKPILIIPSNSNYDDNKYVFAYGVGWEVDFWLKNGSCFYIGIKGEREINSNGNNDFYPTAFRSTFGVQIFLNKMRFGIFL